MSPINSAFIIVTLGIALQIVILLLLVYGYWLNKRLMFPRHGKIMAMAVILHVTTIFAIMIPSFVLAVIPQYIVPQVAGDVSVVTLIHVPLGAAAVFLGLWFVVSWRFQGLKGCFNRKKLMLPTMIIWLASLFFGIFLYLILNWAILVG